MYFASLRSVSVNPATDNLRQAESNQPQHGAALLHKSRSLGTLPRGLERRSLMGEVTVDGDTAGGTRNVQSEGEQFQTTNPSRAVRVRPLSASRSSTAVRFAGSTGGSEPKEVQKLEGNANGVVRGGNAVAAPASEGGNAAVEEKQSCDEKVAGKMRRGSEMASWAVCGTRQKSARDYLW